VPENFLTLVGGVIVGYESFVAGNIKMTKDAYNRLIKEQVPLQDGKLSEEKIHEQFENFEYNEEDGTLDIDSNGKHYNLDQCIALIAKFKDIDTAEDVRYTGDSSDDVVRFVVCKGFYTSFNVWSIAECITESMTGNVDFLKSFLTARRLSGESFDLGDDDLISWIKEVSHDR
jgi:hypothetical protein